MMDAWFRRKVATNDRIAAVVTGAVALAFFVAAVLYL